MCEIRYIKADNIFPIINEILNEGKGVRITVTGRSMHPFLRENIDSVELFQGDFNNAHRGDVVMILRNSGEYVMHRILKKEKDCFYMVGDAQCRIEGPLMPEQLVAGVRAVWRCKKRIECSNIWWKVLSALWLWLLPSRKYIFKVYKFALDKM